jgi:Protein of unknown function (DUF3046)
VRTSEFWSRLKQVYPNAETFAQDVAITELDSLTIKQALNKGFEADEIWKILVKRDPIIDSKWQ